MAEARSQGEVVRFGAYEADFRKGELRKDGVKVRLQDQPFHILRMLLERPGEVVTREQLQQSVWPPGTFVDFEQGLHNAIKRLREALEDSADNPSYIETVPRHGYRFIGTLKAPVAGIQSLAVLPLENLSRDPEQEYFADGLTEALITNLAKISALRVVSRTSVSRYKGLRKPLRDIARELGVEGIVEGTVLRSGRRVRISAQLIDASSDSHLWAEEYERDIRDVLRLQAEVARAIATEIRIKLTSREQKELEQGRAVDPEAYELYLKGRFYWNRRTPDAVRKSAGYFQRAIDRDPSYAAAYAGLADCAGVSGFWCFANPEQGCGKAKMAAQRALQLEETAEAHSSLGWAAMHYDYDFQSAQNEFRRAIAINPRYATAHQWYGQSLSYMGRFEEACAETHKALELEPLSLIVQTSHAAVYWVARQWDRSTELCLKILDFDPNFVSARCLLAHLHQALGKYDEAIEERQRAVALTGDATFFRAELAGTLAAARRRREADDALHELLEISKVEYVSAHSIALIYAGLNEADRAFQWLEKAFEERSAILAWIKTDPRFDNVRPDPRFNDLLRRMRFPT